MRQLCNRTLRELTHVSVPRYQRQALQGGMVHIGVGAFHRAHQAAYTEQVLNDGDLRWGTIGASLRSTQVSDVLKTQDCLYTVATLEQEAMDLQIHGGLLDVVNTAEALVAAIADPGTQVVTLTITEKGYADETPAGVPALLARALSRRSQDNAPLTVVSCDNLMANGRALAQRVLAQCDAPGLQAWVKDNVAFPNTMVDRITPRVTSADRDRITAVAGYEDRAPVVCEPFKQWVIEDHFFTARPAWELGGAEVVSDVAPYEQVKLRILNASHSLFAYLGLLKGYEFIHQAVADDQLREFALQTLEHEIKPHLEVPSGMQVDRYIASVLARFANASVPYRTAQVAGDGSQKMPQRIFPSAQAVWQIDAAAPRLEFVLCAWLRTLAGKDDHGKDIEYDDVGAEAARQALRAQNSSGDHVAAVAAESSLLAALPDAVIQRMRAGYARLAGQGVSASLRGWSTRDE